jgi:hypothetical protein
VTCTGRCSSTVRAIGEVEGLQSIRGVGYRIER